MHTFEFFAYEAYSHMQSTAQRYYKFSARFSSMIRTKKHRMLTEQNITKNVEFYAFIIVITIHTHTYILDVFAR